MNRYIIYLKCDTGAGYFTGIKVTSTGREVGVHTSKFRAYKFEDRNTAWNYAKSLKANFKCIHSYDVLPE